MNDRPLVLDGQTATAPEMAAIFGQTQRQIAKLAEDGYLVRVEHGVYDLEKSIRAYLNFLRGRLERGEIRDEEREGRARKSSADAELAEMNLAKAKEELLPRDEIHSAVTAVFGRVRSKLLAIPAKTTPLILGLFDQTTPAISSQVNDLIETSVNDALSELSQTQILQKQANAKG